MELHTPKPNPLIRVPSREPRIAQIEQKKLELVLHNKYDTLLGISELVYIHILLLDRISRPGHPIVGSIIHCYTQAFYALCALSHNNCNANHRI